MSKKVGILVGSSRPGSYSQLVAETVSQRLSQSFVIETLPINHLGLFDQGLDDADHSPVEWTEFRDKVKKLDGYVFITPEHNRSIPAVLKNALDIASRPYGENGWNDKPAAIISVSPGAIGGFGANHHLRQVLSFLNVHTMDQPEMYIGHIADSMNDDGILMEKTVDFINSAVDSYVQWADQNFK
ncbi:NADPH-dependent FMN reductase [Vagococcus vulneris]|uniref:NADPH-dependent FMN reductase n=1 Tax=Vagococcus vulneris TaxID=1977869 RepID=A0A429ZUN9_9ENTE|nr:NAD(P)H-dependent oxidoreductase [Vagococcus vulneris]RST97350.1 NADPH-dependent FMN reductase [Vagococcus vulneris]